MFSLVLLEQGTNSSTASQVLGIHLAQVFHQDGMFALGERTCFPWPIISQEAKLARSLLLGFLASPVRWIFLARDSQTVNVLLFFLKRTESTTLGFSSHALAEGTWMTLPFHLAESKCCLGHCGKNDQETENDKDGGSSHFCWMSCDIHW